MPLLLHVFCTTPKSALRIARIKRSATLAPVFQQLARYLEIPPHTKKGAPDRRCQERLDGLRDLIRWRLSPRY